MQHQETENREWDGLSDACIRVEMEEGTEGMEDIQ